ncbi:cupredoxin [Artemisia annua]|uniref:Cupredoxin n=1 Tax=Artemisia annua TaxID=35608 RepID=A0A2U1LEX6_ARTAN|nr:cupredoxin [Artemisia annua]
MKHEDANEDEKNNEIGYKRLMGQGSVTFAIREVLQHHLILDGLFIFFRQNLIASEQRPNPQGPYHYGMVNFKIYTLNSVSFTPADTPLKIADYSTILGVFSLEPFLPALMPVVVTFKHPSWLLISEALLKLFFSESRRYRAVMPH